MLRLSSLLALASARATDYGPLSPGLWTRQELEAVEALHLTGGPRPEARGAAGMIAGSSSALAVHVGRTALALGGNAMDAAVATAMAQATVVANEYVSWAGTVDAVYFNAGAGTAHGVQGGWRVPAATDPSMIQRSGRSYSGADGPFPLGASVPVPGFARGLEAALARHGSGRFTWSDVVGASHFLAAEGFVPATGLRSAPKLSLAVPVLNRTDFGGELSKRLLGLGDGELFVQPELAELLARLRSDGASAMYKGRFAEEAVDLMRSWGSNATVEDFEGYAAQFVEPVTIPQAAGGRSVITGGVGAGNLGELLLLFKVAGLGEEPRYDSPEGVHVLEAMVAFSRWGTYVRSMAMWEPNRQRLQEYYNDIFPVENPPHWNGVPTYEQLVGYRTTEEYAARVWSHFNGSAQAINVEVDERIPSKWSAPQTTHSDAIVVVDRAGNAVSMVHTINSYPWGSGLFVNGVALSNALSVHTGWAHRDSEGFLAGAYGYPWLVPNELMPCIAVNDEAEPSSRVEAAVSVISDSLQEVTPQILWRVLLYGDTPKQASDGAHLKRGGSGHGMKSLAMLAVENNCASLAGSSQAVCERIMPMLNAFSLEVTKNFPEELQSYVQVTRASTSDPGDSVGRGHSGMPAIIARAGDEWVGCSTPVVNGGAEGVGIEATRLV